MAVEMEKYSLLLLAGGKSSRMGTDKGNLSYQGKSFVETLIDKGRQVGITKLFLSGHDCKREDVTVIADAYKDCGPMGGIHACMRAIDTPYCLVLPVDVPQIPVEILMGLLEKHQVLQEEKDAAKALIFKHGDREEPLIGIFSVELGQEMEASIKKQKYSIFHVLNQTGYQVFEKHLPSWQVANINTPQAYQELLNTEYR